MADDSDKRAEIAKAVTGIEFRPVFGDTDFMIRDSAKVPLAELAAAGLRQRPCYLCSGK